MQRDIYIYTFHSQPQASAEQTSKFGHVDFNRVLCLQSFIDSVGLRRKSTAISDAALAGKVLGIDLVP